MNAPNTTTQQLILVAGVDQRRAQEAIKALNDLEKATRSTKAAFTDYLNSTKAGVASTASQIQAMSTSFQSSTTQLQQFSDMQIAGRFRRFGMAAGQVFGQNDIAQQAFRGGSDIALGVQALHDLPAIFNQLAGSIPILNQSAQSGIQLVKTITGGGALDVETKFISQLGTLIGAGGLLAVGAIAVGAIAIAFHQFDQELDAGKKILEDASAATTEYYKVIRDGTTESLRAQRDKAQADRDAAAEELKVRTAARESGFEGAKEWAKGMGPLADLTARFVISVGQGRGAFDANDKAIDQLGKTIDDADAKIEGINSALGSTKVASNDATQALLAQAKATEDQAKAEATALGRTSQATRDRISAIDTEKVGVQGAMDVLNKALMTTMDPDALTAIGSKIIDYNAQLGKLDAEQQDLLTHILPLILARENEKKMVEDMIKGVIDLNKQYQDLTKLQQEIGANEEARQTADQRAGIEANFKRRIDQAKSNEQILAIEKNLQDTRIAQADAAAKAVAAFNDQQFIQDRNFMRSEMDATETFQRQQLKSEDAYARERQKTLRDLNETLAEKAAEGDVAGFVQAQRSGEKTLRDQAETHDQQTKDQIEAFAQQRADALKHYNRQKSDALEAFQKQQEQTRQQDAEVLQKMREQHTKVVSQSKALEDELTALKLQWQKEDEQKRRAVEDAAFQERMAVIQARQQQDLQLVSNYYNAVQAKVNSLIMGLTGWYQPATITPSPHTGSGGGAYYHASGLSYVPFDNYPAMLHRGERVIPAAQNQGGMGLTIGSITIGAGNAVTPQDVERALEQFQRNIQTALTQSRRLSA